MRFLIVGLPRSRTAWFSAYFSACGYLCIHETIKYCDSLEDYKNLINLYGCDSSSAGMLCPEIFDRIVIIERDISEVFESLLYQSDQYDKKKLLNVLITLKEKMDLMIGLRIPYNDINNRLQEIHEYCVPTPFNHLISQQYKNMKIELLNIHSELPGFAGELLWQ